MATQQQIKTENWDNLGQRAVGSTAMMAGYYSSFTHDAVYREVTSIVPDRSSSVLDVGAGHGAFCEKLQQAGYTNLYAIEPFAEFTLPGVELSRANLNDSWDLSIGDHSLDGVVAVEIIEHIENPYHFLRQIKKYLKPNGSLVVSTPRTVEFMARLRFLRSGTLDMMAHPDHRTPIFPDTLRKMCSEVGFSIQKSTFDLDTLHTPSRTFRGKLLKPLARMGRSLISGGPNDPRGNSSIWILAPSDAEPHVPGTH